MSDLDKFKRLDAEARRKAARLEDQFTTKAEALMAAWLRIAEKNLKRHAHGSHWRVPDADEILDRFMMQLMMQDTMHPLRLKVIERVMRSTLVEFGIGFDVRNPLVEGVLHQLGRHITNVTEDYRQQLMGHLDDAWRDGLSVQDAGKRIAVEMPGISRSRAERIARTEILGAVNGGSLAAARITGVAQFKTWLATGDARTRPEHLAADGQTVPIDGFFDVGGESLQYPGDFGGSADMVINCRCVTTLSNSPTGDLESLLAGGKLGGRMSATPFKDLPLGEREESWDGAAAVKAMEGEEALTRGHFWKDPEGDPESKSSYKLPFVSDGHAVWGAVTAAAAALGGGRGGVDIPADDVGGVQSHVGRYYQKAATKYDDDSITPPWGDASMTAAGRVTGRITQTFRDLTAAADPSRARWRGEIMFTDQWTSDGRMMVSPPGDAWEDGTAWHRDLPLPLMAMFEDAHGGMINGIAVSAGQIDTLALVGNTVVAEGSFNSEPDGGVRALAAAESGDLVGISVDTELLEWEVEIPPVPVDEASGEPMDEVPSDQPIIVEDSVEAGPKMRATKWRLMGATQVPFPAFEDARISVAAGEPSSEPVAVTASAAGLAPVAAPSDWFRNPDLDGPTPLTVTEDGYVYGHACLWDSCHTAHGISVAQGQECLMPPRSRAGYAYYQLGEYHTKDDRTVNVGVITMDTGHAPMGAPRSDVTAHYDHTGTHAAYVVTGEDEYGVWFSGTLAPDIPAADVVRLRASKLSGDWRNVNGHLELVGILAVNTPGFPVPRARIAASAGIEEVVSLVAAGPVTPVADEYEFDRNVLRIVHGRDGLIKRIAG